MQCPNCQTVLPDDASVCPNCGSGAPTVRLSPPSEPRVLRCMRCHDPLEEGYIHVPGGHSPRWHSRAEAAGVMGALFGAANDRRDVVAYRCTHCGHVELFAY